MLIASALVAPRRDRLKLEGNIYNSIMPSAVCVFVCLRSPALMMREGSRACGVYPFPRSWRVQVETWEELYNSYMGRLMLFHAVQLSRGPLPFLQIVQAFSMFRGAV